MWTAHLSWGDVSTTRNESQTLKENPGTLSTRDDEVNGKRISALWDYLIICTWKFLLPVKKHPIWLITKLSSFGDSILFLDTEVARLIWWGKHAHLSMMWDISSGNGGVCRIFLCSALIYCTPTVCWYQPRIFLAFLVLSVGWGTVTKIIIPNLYIH